MEAIAEHREQALALVHPFEKNYQTSNINVEWIAMVYGVLGDEDKTMLWLESSVDRRETQLLMFAVNPAFAKMHQNPRFLALKRRIGLDRLPTQLVKNNLQ